jgi:hypothetical protein
MSVKAADVLPGEITTSTASLPWSSIFSFNALIRHYLRVLKIGKQRMPGFHSQLCLS